MNHYRASRFNI